MFSGIGSASCWVLACQLRVILLFFVSGVCRESAAVMPLTTPSGEQVGGTALDALPEVLLIFGTNGF
jgi:hypothetical protein